MLIASIRNCAFVNYSWTFRMRLVKVIKVIKTKPGYTNLRNLGIVHGKDTCANPPMSGLQASG